MNIHSFRNNLKVKKRRHDYVASSMIFVVFVPMENVVVLLMIDYSTVLSIHLYFFHRTFVQHQDSSHHNKNYPFDNSFVIPLLMHIFLHLITNQMNLYRFWPIDPIKYFLKLLSMDRIRHVLLLP